MKNYYHNIVKQESSFDSFKQFEVNKLIKTDTNNEEKENQSLIVVDNDQSHQTTEHKSERNDDIDEIKDILPLPHTVLYRIYGQLFSGYDLSLDSDSSSDSSSNDEEPGPFCRIIPRPFGNGVPKKRKAPKKKEVWTEDSFRRWGCSLDLSKDSSFVFQNYDDQVQYVNIANVVSKNTKFPSEICKIIAELATQCKIIAEHLTQCCFCDKDLLYLKEGDLEKINIFEVKRNQKLRGRDQKIRGGKCCENCKNIHQCNGCSDLSFFHRCRNRMCLCYYYATVPVYDDCAFIRPRCNDCTSKRTQKNTKILESIWIKKRNEGLENYWYQSI